MRRLLAATALLPLLLLGQEKQEKPDQPPIRVQVNEVIVPVTVTDEKGRFVSDLEKKDFHIFDEGREQKIDYFSRDRSQPVVVGFLLDMSNGMKIQWKKYQDAVNELILNLLPGDKRYSGYLITYGNQPELQVNTTSDNEAMVGKLDKLKPGGGSALFDAIYMACTRRSLVKGEPFEPRRIMVIVGDGHDTASKHTLAEVVELAQRNLITIYGMSTVAFGFKTEGEENLMRLVQETGGRIEAPLNSGLYKDISGYLSVPSDEGNFAYKVGTGGYAGEISRAIFHAVTDIAGEVTTQYILRYIPDTSNDSGKSANKQLRSLKVTVDLPNVKVRYRKGYYPNAVPGAATGTP